MFSASGFSPSSFSQNAFLFSGVTPEPEPQPEPQPGHTPGGGGSGGAGGGFLHRRTLRRRHAPDIDVELLVDETLDEQDVLDLFHLLLQSGMIE